MVKAQRKYNICRFLLAGVYSLWKKLPFRSWNYFVLGFPVACSVSEDPVTVLHECLVFSAYPQTHGRKRCENLTACCPGGSRHPTLNSKPGACVFPSTERWRMRQLYPDRHTQRPRGETHKDLAPAHAIIKCMG